MGRRIKPYRGRSLPGRVSALEKKYRQSKPEMKCLSHTSVPVSIVNASVRTVVVGNPAAGSDVNQRIGNEILIHSVEVYGNVGDFVNDAYLILAPAGYGSQPVYANFQAVSGGHINGFNAREFVTLRHSLNLTGANSNFHFKHKFKTPLRVQYSGPAITDCIKNQLYVVVKNDSGAAAEVQFGTRIWYTDP